MINFNYQAPAELYPSRRFAKSSLGQYRRFATAAEAVRYMIEEMPPTWLPGSFLEVDEKRYEGTSVRELYDAESYPLTRMTAAA